MFLIIFVCFLVVERTQWSYLVVDLSNFASSFEVATSRHRDHGIL